MNVKDRLAPKDSARVMDLVAAAGVDVAPWAQSKKGPVLVPASNPAYCYEWAFVQLGQVVVLNLWHDQIDELNGQLSSVLNLRAWAEKLRTWSELRPSQCSVGLGRAKRMEKAIAYAYENQLPIRVIVGAAQGATRRTRTRRPRRSRASNSGSV